MSKKNISFQSKSIVHHEQKIQAQEVAVSVQEVAVSTQEIELATRGKDQSEMLPNAPFRSPGCEICTGKTGVYHTAGAVRYLKCERCGWTFKRQGSVRY